MDEGAVETEAACFEKKTAEMKQKGGLPKPKLKKKVGN